MRHCGAREALSSQPRVQHAATGGQGARSWAEGVRAIDGASLRCATCMRATICGPHTADRKRVTCNTYLLVSSLTWHTTIASTRSRSTVVPIVPCSAVRRPKRTSDRAGRAMKRRLDGGRPALRTGGRPARGRAVQLAAPPAGCACAPCCRRSVAAGAPGERRPLVCCHVAAPRRRLSDAARLHQPAAPQLEQAQRRRQCCDACGRAAGSSRSRP